MGIIGPSAPTGPAGGSLSGTYPNPGIANEVISGSNLIANTITPTQTKRTPITAKPAEKVVNIGAAGLPRHVFAYYQSDGVETNIKVKHGLTGARGVVIAIHKVSGETITEALIQGKGASAEEYTWKGVAGSDEEIEVKFGAAPAAKSEFIITIVGS